MDGLLTARYSRSHCFTTILKDAAMRLERRLANQNALTSTRESKESEGPGEANTERFEGSSVILLSEFWSAMRRRT